MGTVSQRVTGGPLILSRRESLLLSPSSCPRLDRGGAGPESFTRVTRPIILSAIGTSSGQELSPRYLIRVMHAKGTDSLSESETSHLLSNKSANWRNLGRSGNLNKVLVECRDFLCGGGIVLLFDKDN